MFLLLIFKGFLDLIYSIFSNHQCIGIQDRVGAQVAGTDNAAFFQVAAGEVDLLFKVGGNKRYFFVGQLQRAKDINELLCFGGVEVEAFQHEDFSGSDFGREGRLASQAADFLVQLEAVVTRARAENAATTAEHGAFDIPCAGSTGTFLALELARRAGKFTSFLCFMRALALVGHMLLDSQINGMFIRFDAENIIREVYFPAGLLTLDINNFEFHLLVCFGAAACLCGGLLLSPKGAFNSTYALNELLFKNHIRPFVAGNCPLDKDQVLFREDLEHFQVFHLHPVSTRAAGHAHSLKYL